VFIPKGVGMAPNQKIFVPYAKSGEGRDSDNESNDHQQIISRFCQKLTD
jgi:hypothetical protein